MEFRVLVLYYLSSIAGFIMVAGGIWLIYKQKIYIDRESKQVTEIETPVGKFKTNIPALVLFVLGFFPLIYPIVRIERFREEIPIKGSLTADLFPVMIYAVTGSDTLLQSGDYSLRVPLPRGTGEEYKILYIVGNNVIETRANLKKMEHGEVVLPKQKIFADVVPIYKQKALPPVPSEFK